MRYLLLTALSLAMLPADAAEFRWVDRQTGMLDLTYGDKPVLRYMYAYDASTPERREETYKVYHHVFGPGTDRIITKGPGGQFPHHRGLYIGWNKTKFVQDGEQAELDFWHCPPKTGNFQQHIRFLNKKADADTATMTSEIHWNDPQGKPVIVETRTVMVSPLVIETSDSPAWQIDWSTRLESRRGEITLAGDRQHAGFQYRADQAVAEAKSGRYIRPADAPQQSDAVEVGDKDVPPKHSDLGWFALTYPLYGEQYTVEYFDNPQLPKPSLFSERPYGRFGTYFTTPLTPDKPLELVYRVVISRGETPSRQQVQNRYDSWIADVKHE